MTWKPASMRPSPGGDAVPVVLLALCCFGCAGTSGPEVVASARPGGGAQAAREDAVEAPTSRARLDLALRSHGDFGVDGDLRGGLAWVEERFVVTLTEQDGRVLVDLGPRSAEGHDFSFSVEADGTIAGVAVGQLEPEPDDTEEPPAPPEMRPDQEVTCQRDSECVAAQSPQCCRCCPCGGARAYSLEFLEWLREQCAREQCPPQPGECVRGDCPACPPNTADRPADAVCEAGRCVLVG